MGHHSTGSGVEEPKEKWLALRGLRRTESHGSEPMASISWVPSEGCDAKMRSTKGFGRPEIGSKSAAWGAETLLTSFGLGLCDLRLTILKY